VFVFIYLFQFSFIFFSFLSFIFLLSILLLKETISIRLDQNLLRKSLCGVLTVNFRVLSLFVVTKCYSYSKTESVIINYNSPW
jgi:hypothetical protein